MSKNAEGLPPINFDLKLTNIRTSRQTFAKIIRAYGKAEIEDKTYKSLVWGMSQYQGYLKLNAEQEILDRIQELELKMESK